MATIKKRYAPDINNYKYLIQKMKEKFMDSTFTKA